MGGTHLIVDAWASHGLNDRAAVSRCLHEMVEMAGMHVIGQTGPQQLPVAEYDSGPGISMAILLVESHASIHTWPETGQVYMDFFSCKPFDTELAFNYFITAFGVTKVEKHRVIDRMEVQH